MNRFVTSALAATSLAAALSAQQYTTLQVVPDAFTLDHVEDRPGFVVLAVRASGVVDDVTATAKATLADDGLAALQDDGPRRRLVARAAGATTLQLRLGDLTASAPVQVLAAPAPPVQFTADVLPVLTHAGCNSGACHGAAAGKNGFGLSLFAYDPATDFRMLTRELRGRRLDPSHPEQSLLLQKGTGAVPHQGGKKLVPGGAGHARLLAWIGAGAPPDPEAAPQLQRLELGPRDLLLVSGSSMPLVVRAHYRDGSDRDVTAWTRWSSSDDSAAAVDAEGLVAARGGGEAALLARYGGLAAMVQVQVLADDAPWTWPLPPTDDLVDRHVHQKLRRARQLPAEPCSDTVFVRRVTFDLLALPPTPDEVRAFVADAAPDKRARLVDALLQRPEFAAAEAMAWADTLLADAERMEPKGAALLSAWLRDGIAAGRPFDAMVRELLTADGATFTHAAANYWLAADQPHLLAEHTAQNFLGLRLQCAQCHDHPFENWTMDDYYGFAAFFGHVTKKRAEDGNEQIVWDRRSGDVRNKRDGAIAPPRFLGGERANLPTAVDRRTALAEWLVAPGNPWFARNLANRVWARLFGRGLVDRFDDVRLGNPPSHPELLQALADLLVHERFDLRALYRRLCASSTYQQARAADGVPAALYAGHHARRLGAEALLDAIGAVTGVPTRYPGQPAGTPATALPGGRTNVRFLDVFGRPPRDSACTCDRRSEPTLGQALHLVNGDTMAQKIAHRDGHLQRALAAGTAAEVMLDELFVRAYARPPRSDERAHLLAVVTAAGDDAKTRTAAWQDVYWAVLNSHEFLFQH
jgi:Protein of unknown function (DUF1553)/Protein of unknown function (DUF1549)